MTPSTSATSRKTGSSMWSGMRAFAAVLLLMLGVFNFFDGLAAIAANDVFITTKNNLLMFDLTGWGWVHLILGVAQVVTGASLLAGQAWARYVGIGLVWLNAIAQMLFLPAYPFWSLLIIGLDIVVIWALVMHYDE